jgi:hypothetical protein
MSDTVLRTGARRALPPPNPGAVRRGLPPPKREVRSGPPPVVQFVFTPPEPLPRPSRPRPPVSAEPPILRSEPPVSVEPPPTLRTEPPVPPSVKRGMSWSVAILILLFAGLASSLGYLLSKVRQLEVVQTPSQDTIAGVELPPANSEEVVQASPTSPSEPRITVDDLPIETASIPRASVPRKKGCRGAVAAKDGAPTPLACPCAMTQGTDTAVVEAMNPIGDMQYLAALRASAERAASEGQPPNGVPVFDDRQVVRDQDEDAGIAPEQAQNEPTPEPVELAPSPTQEEGAVATAPIQYRPDDL